MYSNDDYVVELLQESGMIMPDDAAAVSGAPGAIKKLIDGTLPRIADALERIADAQLTAIERDKNTPEAKWEGGMVDRLMRANEALESQLAATDVLLKEARDVAGFARAGKYAANDKFPWELRE